MVDASASPAIEVEEAPFAVDVLRAQPGLTRQRNIGLEHARGDLVVFFDDDMELYGGYLEQITAWFAAHPACVGASGNIVNETPRPMLSRAYRRIFDLANDDGRLRKSGDAAYLRLPRRATRVDSLSGGNMVYRRAVIADMRFDEHLGTYGGEDVDFSLRVGRRGELWMVPDARIVHKKATTARVPRRDYVRQTIEATAYLYAKHRRSRSLGRIAFGRRLAGRVLAYALLSFAYRSADPICGAADGLRQVPKMLALGWANSAD